MTKRKKYKNTHKDPHPVSYALHRLCPYDEKYLMVLGNELLEEARTRKDLLRAKDLITERGMSHNDFLGYCKRSDYLKRCWSIIKDTISSRRERGALSGKLNAKVVLAMLPLYDDEYANLLQERDDRRSKDISGSSGNIVVIEKAADSPLVPKKKVKDNE